MFSQSKEKGGLGGTLHCGVHHAPLLWRGQWDHSGGEGEGGGGKLLWTIVWWVHFIDISAEFGFRYKRSHNQMKREGRRHVQPLVMAIAWLVGLQKIRQNPFRSDRFLQIWFDIFGHGMETTFHGWKVYSKKH